MLSRTFRGDRYLQGGKVELFLALEVIVKKSFIHVRGGGDAFRARACQTVEGELAERRVEDAAAGLSGAFRRRGSGLVGHS